MTIRGDSMDTEKEIRRIISKFIIKRPVLGAICLRMKYEAKPIPKKKIRIAEGIEVETYNPFAITPATNILEISINRFLHFLNEGIRRLFTSENN